jgi:hypothetical protein
MSCRCSRLLAHFGLAVVITEGVPVHDTFDAGEQFQARAGPGRRTRMAERFQTRFDGAGQ